MSTDVLVIIPTYNERDNLVATISAVRQALPTGHILIVDDNSPDGTGKLAKKLRAHDPAIHVLHRPEKAGLGRAYQAGFAWALKRDYQYICTMDADGSHDASVLPALVQLAQETADVAIGSRYISGGTIEGWTWDRYLLSWSANWLTRLLLSLRPNDVTAGYKCYRRSFLEKLELEHILSPGYAFQVEMLTRAQNMDLRLVELPINFRDRTIGRSKVSRHELLGSFKSLGQLVLRRRGVRQAGKFSVVGFVNFLFDIGVTNALVLLAHVEPRLAGYAGVATALSCSFILNRYWTFRGQHGPATSQMARFFTVHGSGALINALAYTLLLRHFSLWYNWAKILAIGASGFWNFLGTKYWVFVSPKHHNGQAEDVTYAASLSERR